MMSNLVLWRHWIWSRESAFAFAIAAVVTSLFMGVLAVSRGESGILLVIPLLTLLLMSVSSFRFSLVLLLISLFLDFQFLAFSSAIWFALPLGLSFAVNYTNFQWKDISNPMTSAIVIYGLCILPSFLYVSRPFISLAMLFNVVAFLIVMYSLASGVNKYSDLVLVVVVYLLMVFIDSLDVIGLSLSGKARPFGFAGIWFVDYSALGICLSVAAAYFTQGLRRFLLIVLAVVVTVALIMTQTRNTWVSGLVTLAFLATYLFLHPELVGLSRKRIVLSFFAGLIVLVVIATVVLTFNPKIEGRVSQLAGKTEISLNQEGLPENSIVMRMLIWDTALNAFLAHPIVGIGVYAFRFASHQYSRLPEFLYYMFVAYRSPHQTQLAVLAETGIIGLIGFIFFQITLLRHSFLSIRLAKSVQGKQFALVGVVCVVYSTISMIFTDAWLWGQQIVLLGVIIGSMFGIRRLNEKDI